MASTLLLPKFVEIEPTQGCNLKCKMCHVYYKKSPFAFLDLTRIDDFGFLKGATVSVGAAHEPLIHPAAVELFEVLGEAGCDIAMVTNAKKLNRALVSALNRTRMKQIIFSFDGITKATYENVRLRGDFARTLDNIGNFIASFDPTVRPIVTVLFTVLRCNMHEVPFAPAFWNKLGVDALSFNAMQVRYNDSFLFDNSLWPVLQDYYALLTAAAEDAFEKQLSLVLSSPFYRSPAFAQRWQSYLQGCKFSATQNWTRDSINFHDRFQNGADFGMRFPCRSPFVAARILFNGDVNLCSIKTVGNLYQNSFEEIWFGEAADARRKAVLNDARICKQCDYYRYCINGASLDLNHPENHFSQAMQKYA